MLYTLYNFVAMAFNVYSTIIFVRVILSWFPINHANPIIRFICDISDPFLNIFRRILPPSPSMPIDFSPVIAIFALQIIARIVLRLLYAILF